MDQPTARSPAADRPAETGSAPAAHGAAHAAAHAAAHSAVPLRRVSSDELLGGAREIEITHGDALYRLRLTALGKLILTK